MGRGFFLLACATALGGCGDIAEQSRMRLPNAPEAQMEQVALTGIGFGRRGSFHLGNSSGQYVRGSGTVGALGYDSTTGDVEFSLEGDDVEGTLSASCHFGQGDLQLTEALSMTVRPLSYRCDFERDGMPLPATLEIHQRGIGGNERRGEFVFEGQRMELRSAHKMKGGGLPSGTPVDYIFMQDGREIGGVDSNGLKLRHVYLPRNEALREAAMAASLALALVWDPGE